MSEGTSTSMQSAPSDPPIKKTLKLIGLVTLFLACLLVFTLTKLPEAKTTALMQGYLQTALDPYGIYITDQGREFSVWRGFRYKLIKPTIELSDQTRIELDEIVASPKLISILMAKPGATVELKQGASSIVLDGTGRGDKVDAHISLTEVNFGKIGILSYLAQIKGGGLISGEFHLNGALSDPNSLSGNANFKLKNVQIDEQSLMGFQLENMKVAEGNIQLEISGGKVQFKTFQLGKPNSADDLNLQVTGDIALNRYLNSSALNLRAVLGISERVKQKLSLIDSLLGNAKQSDGRYAYKLTGQLSSPFPNPDPK